MHSPCLRTLLMFSPLFSMLALFIVRASTVDSPAVSTFGSTAAQVTHFHWQRSDFRPNHYLTAPGSLAGHWLVPNRTSYLKVDFLTGRDDYSDQFIIRTGSSNIPFQSCYGQFLIYGCDVTGDGIDEIILEDGRGRGTFVYQRRLRIFKSHGNDWHPIFMIWLSDYLPSPERTDLMWLRRYFFQANQQHGYNLVFDLYPPCDIPSPLADFDINLTLQLQHFVVYYNSESKAFYLRDFKISPPTKSGDTDAGPLSRILFRPNWIHPDETVNILRQSIRSRELCISVLHSQTGH